MNFQTVLDNVWNFFNSPFGFALVWALVVGFFIWLSSRFNPFVEKWKAYEGSIITAIKTVEKSVPDDIPNAGLVKLDKALKFVIDAYGQANNGKKPSEKLIEAIKQGIQIKHSDLDRFGGLTKRNS